MKINTSRFERLPDKLFAHKQLAICAAVIGVAALTSVSIFATGPAAEPDKPVEKAWPVSVISAEKKRLQPNFSAFGKMEATQIAALRSELIAPVRQVLVKEGDWAEAGEVLVRLDDREAQLKLLQRQAELKRHDAHLLSARSRLEMENTNAPHFASRQQVAQAKLRRHQDLMHKRLIARSLLDEVTSQANKISIEYRNHQRELSHLPNQIAVHEADVAKARALLRQAQIDVEKTRITAPFSGPVLGVFVAAGDLSNLTAPLLQLADADSFELRVQIPDLHLPQFNQALSLNRTSPITAHTRDGQNLRLTRMAGQVRSGQTGVDAFFTFNTPLPGAQTSSLSNRAPTLAPTLGTVLQVSVALPAQEDLIALPVQSIYANQRIYAVQDNRLVGHEVERVGERHSARHGYQVLVRSKQLQSGDPVITTQLPKAISGLLVKVANKPRHGVNES